MLARLSVLLTWFAGLAAGDVLFTSPLAGSSFPVGNLPITWKESGTAPLISTLVSYQIELVAGGSDPSTQIVPAVFVRNGAFSAGNVAAGVTTEGMGDSLTNAYFLRITSTATGGGQVINYSDRFTITGMTTKFPDAIANGINALTSNKGPSTENNVNNNDAAAAAAAANGPATPGMPYSLQQGLTRFAPMQGVPPTKITAKTASPLYPTSAFSIAKTFLPTPQAKTTITAAQTFSVSSVENTAAAASKPVPASNAAVKRAMERWNDE